MRESTKKNQNNQVHIYGYINGVRMNEFESNGKKKTAINLDVCTLEQYKDKDGASQTKRSYHDVAIFTDDKKLIKQFSGIAADCDKNAANREVDGYKPAVHSISADGILVNKTNTIEGTETTYRTLQVLAGADSIDLDAKQAEKEVRNSAKIVGNVANIYLNEEKKFAVVTLMHHYRPEGAEKDFETTVDVRLNGDRRFSKAAYEALLKGEIGKGDFVRMGGQLHNSRSEDGRYTVAIDLTSFDMLKRKEAKKEEVKAAPKKAAAKKEAKAAKKATPRKKSTGLKA